MATVLKTAALYLWLRPNDGGRQFNQNENVLQLSRARHGALIGKEHGKTCASPARHRGRADPDHAAMLLDNSLRHPQPQPCSAFAFCSEERIKNLCTILTAMPEPVSEIVIRAPGWPVSRD